jgi:hypothetical protein
MNRRDESEFPFAYLSERPDRSMTETPSASPARRNNSANVSRSMTQQIQILMLIAFASLLIFLILLYITIMTVTADSRITNGQTMQTSVTQSEVSLSDTTELT